MTVVIRGGGGNDQKQQKSHSHLIPRSFRERNNRPNLINSDNSMVDPSRNPVDQANNSEASIFSISGEEPNVRQRSDNEVALNDDGITQVTFPLAELSRLDDMISRPRWVIPVLPKGELEVLLQASLDLCRMKLDTRCEPCQRFFREGLTVSFTKVLTDEAVTGWKFEIHRCIMQNCERLIELCVLKLDQDCYPLLDLLAMVLNPINKFHMFTISRPDSLTGSKSSLEEEVFARSPDARTPRGWLIDLINRFGKLGGFRILLERFGRSNTLSVPLIAALLKPFGLCYEYLTQETVRNYFSPIIETVPVFLEQLTDEELKKESKNEAKNDVLSGIVKSLKNLASRIPNQEDTIRDLEIFRLRMILRLLQISSFNGKMNALNEVNKVIAMVSCNSHRHTNEGTVLNQSTQSGVSGALVVNRCISSNIKSSVGMSTSGGVNTASVSGTEVSGTVGNENISLPPNNMSIYMSGEEENWLTAERMANWIRENKVLQIVLGDSLHQPQYVEKLEKIIRFVIKEKALTLEDLDDLWAAQCGKHEAIVKNMHDLLAKLAWDFTPEQLDHLFECFRASWTKATKKQREKLLELIRRLAEDDKDGVMAYKVLNLLWNLAHNDDIPTDIMDQALAALVKILDYSCCQDRDSQKTEWLEKCIEELKNDESDWVLPALKLIREICYLYSEAQANFAPTPLATSVAGSILPIDNVPSGPVDPDLFYRPTTANTSNALTAISAAHQITSSMITYRHEVITQLQSQHSMIVLVSENLSNYIAKARQIYKSNRDLDAHTIYPGSRFSHAQEIQERLSFLRFLLKDGRLWLCSPQAKQIWKCLAENAIFPDDRDACFRWFTQLMSEDPDLDPKTNKSFFESNILQLDPSLVNESGIECFDRFFKTVNLKEEKLIIKRRTYYTEDLELIGLDYLWRVVLNCSEEVANSGIELLKETYTNLGPRLLSSQLEIHSEFIQICMDRLHAFYDTLTILRQDETANERVRYELVRLNRVLYLLFEYINQCDSDFPDERTILPMEKSSRGKQVSLTIKFPNQGRHVEDIQISTHRNEYLSIVKRQILVKMKAINSNMRIDLFLNEDAVDSDINKEEKFVSELPMKDELVLSAKLYQAANIIPSSPDSSSDSSAGSPPNTYIGPNIEAENSLPGVMISQNHEYANFFFKLCDLGMSLDYEPLCFTGLTILNILPHDRVTAENLRTICRIYAESNEDSQGIFDEIFYGPSPTQVSYSLMVIYSLLMPSRNPLSEESRKFQYDFIKSGCGFKVLELLTRNNFLSSAVDLAKILTYGIVLRISKLVLTFLGYYLVRSFLNDCDDERICTLKLALTSIPNPISASMFREVALEITKTLLAKEETGLREKAIKSLPDISTVKAIMIIAWVTATGRVVSLQEKIENLHQLVSCSNSEPINDIYSACKDALEVLTISLMLSPHLLEQLMDDVIWQDFIIEMLLISHERSIRITALEQFILIATKCANGNEVLVNFISLLYKHLGTSVSVNGHYQNSLEFFQLFCKLLSHACTAKCSLPQLQELLEYEIDVLHNVRHKLVKDDLVVDTLLEGHLGITKELIHFLSPAAKRDVGIRSDSKVDGSKNKGLIRILIDEYVFPSSRGIVLQQRSHLMDVLRNTNSSNNVHIEEINPICTTPATLTAAFDCLVALCTGCIPNLKYVADTLIEMFYNDNEQPLTEWEYLPPIGPRPTRGFVGLKNAGATCYMNSVFQQLYMIPEIRDGILSVEGAITDPSEDFSGDDRMDGLMLMTGSTIIEEERKNSQESRKDYNLGVFKYTQAIFGHLALSKLQYYVPKGFWRHFKLWGEPVNLREQHDALEFFNSLVDSIDEALKSLNYPPLMSRVLGGSFADQKICKDCPHRYSRQEPFTTLNIDIRNHCNLLDSLEQYVKGDLLEGANAYHCEKCDRKVETVKRLCIKTLPTVLTIQLKRFDYDFERSCAIKFNDYFEFPRVLDMEPYTVRGLAKIEGEIIEDDLVLFEDDAFNGTMVCTKFELCGIVVHSGQASGGHYYSYILYKQIDGTRKWYKFDDGDVTECKLDDDEEMRIQCFGGEYMGEVFDHISKRMSCRRQKRWWNAYILFYRRMDTQESQLSMRLNELTLMESKVNDAQIMKMPVAIERSVQKQNIKFMHIKNQFSLEYFQFIKDLLTTNGQIVVTYCDKSDLISSPTNLTSLSSTSATESLTTTTSNFTSNSTNATPSSTNTNVTKAFSSFPSTFLLSPTHCFEKKDAEEIAMICTKLATRFLFMTCFHTKKALRGSALEWAEVLNYHLGASPSVRAWFARDVFLSHHYRFCEYLLDCPNNDVRSAFGKIIVFIAHHSLRDNDVHASVYTNDENAITNAGVRFSDCLFQTVLSLLQKDVSEHSRHLSQYFNLFYQYASLGSEERTQLLRLNVPATFILVALDEGPGPPIKSQYADFTKLYQVVSLLVRCCDVSSKCASSQTGKAPLPNPYRLQEQNEPFIPIQPQVYEHLYDKTSYVKKIIEDANNTDDTIKLLKFCCWENPHFSSMILGELLWQIAYTYAYELRPHLDLMFHMLMIEDSWQEHRIHNALRGMQDDREGLFETIHRNKHHYQKRAYQCIKCLVLLFSNCAKAVKILHSVVDIKKKWISAVTWLSEELERRPYASNNQYSYSWSPPPASNEASNGYYLERSNSAKLTLSKAFELCPGDEREDLEDEEISSRENDSSPFPPPNVCPNSTTASTSTVTSSNSGCTFTYSIGSRYRSMHSKPRCELRNDAIANDMSGLTDLFSTLESTLDPTFRLSYIHVAQPRSNSDNGNNTNI